MGYRWGRGVFTAFWRWGEGGSFGGKFRETDTYIENLRSDRRVRYTRNFKFDNYDPDQIIDKDFLWPKRLQCWIYGIHPMLSIPRGMVVPGHVQRRHLSLALRPIPPPEQDTVSMGPNGDWGISGGDPLPPTNPIDTEAADGSASECLPRAYSSSVTSEGPLHQ